MNYYKIVASTLAVLLLASAITFGGGQNRAGTAAAPELLIPIGARYLGMGGAPVATAMGIEAIYWNPAGLDLSPRTANALFSYRSYIADMSVNFFGVSGKFGFGTLALSLRSFNVGDIQVTTENQPDGTGEIFTPTFFVAGLSYSKQLADRISIGLTANVINESFTRVSATDVAFDAGVQYKDLVGISGLMAGVTVKNIGPAMTYGGSGLLVPAQVIGSDREITYYSVQAATFELPSVFEIGLAYRYSVDDMNLLDVSSTFQNNNFAYDEYRVGVEYSYNQQFFVRFGGLFAPSSNAGQVALFEDYTLGAGINFTDVGGSDIGFDYAYVPVQFGLFDANHVISLRVGF